MNCFFMDLVSNLCFDKVNNLPEKEVIDAIIESFLPKPQVKVNTYELFFLVSISIVELHLKKIDLKLKFVNLIEDNFYSTLGHI